MESVERGAHVDRYVVYGYPFNLPAKEGMTVELRGAVSIRFTEYVDFVDDVITGALGRMHENEALRMLAPMS